MTKVCRRPPLNYSSKRPLQVPFLTAKNGKLRLRFNRLTKLNKSRLEKYRLVMSYNFCCTIQMVGSSEGKTWY